MRNTTDWIREMEETLDGLKDGKIGPRDAHARLATVGKVIGITKLQMAYNKIQAATAAENRKAIPLLEDSTQEAKS